MFTRVRKTLSRTANKIKDRTQGIHGKWVEAFAEPP